MNTRMTNRTYEGIVVNGTIQLPLGVHLPEHAKVLITLTDSMQVPTGSIATPRLAHPEQLGEFQMEVEEMPDASL